MSNKPKIHRFTSRKRLVTRIRNDDLNNPTDETKFVLLYAYNGIGKTRLSMEFKEVGKRKNKGTPDTLYFNAFTEDLFTWDNDLEADLEPRLLINAYSNFFSGFRDLELADHIAEHFGKHCKSRFEISYYSNEDIEAMADTKSASHHLYQRLGREGLETKPKYIRFKVEGCPNYIKISRGEERIFIWCLFLAIIGQALKGESSYNWVKFVYIDDPISSLDDNNAIAMASDLTRLLREGQNRWKVVVSSHHALFFNVVCNELKKLPHKKYFLHCPGQGTAYTLRSTDETPFFHHVAMLAELQDATKSGDLYTYHFNILRNILEKTATFFGHDDFSACIDGEKDEDLYSRALNLLSHGKYSLFEPKEMVDDNKKLFKRILTSFLNRYSFALPLIFKKPPTSVAELNPTEVDTPVTGAKP